MTTPLAAPTQPAGRNWRSISIAAGVATLCTVAFVWYSVVGKNEEPTQRAERTDFTHRRAELPAQVRRRVIGCPSRCHRRHRYRHAGAGRTHTGASGVRAGAPKLAEPKPPKPMLSMFATTPDPTAFQPAADAGDAGRPPRQQTEYRPGTSGGIDRLERP